MNKTLSWGCRGMFQMVQKTRSLLLLFLLTLATTASAGLGPHNLLVVYDPLDANGLAIANAYRQIRQVPERNFVPYTFPKWQENTPTPLFSITRQQVYEFIEFLRYTMALRGISAQIDAVVIAGQTPIRVQDDTDSEAQFQSIQFPLYFGPTLTSASNLIYQVNEENHVGNWPANLAFRGPGDTAPALPAVEMNSAKAWGTNSLGTNYYWMVSSLGYTGPRGNSVADIIANLERSKSSDGTFPSGTIYWSVNGDERNLIREEDRPPNFLNQIRQVTNEWNSLGIDYIFFEEAVPTRNTNSSILAPIDEQPALGLLAGSPVITLPPGTLYAPGSIAEHVTSLGADFSDPFQTPISVWIRAGVAGTHGTVVEPGSHWRKFPHARIHSHYARGASLGEAFWESIQWPIQSFVMGDPLTRPFAHIPVIAITSPSGGGTVSGVIPISFSASSSTPVESRFDLLVDGRVLGAPELESVLYSRTNGGFLLDTRSLGDGYHEIRVVGYAASAFRTPGFARKEIRVNNRGAALTISGPAVLDRTGSGVYSVTLGAGMTAYDLQLRAAGRVLAELPVRGGTVSVRADSLAADQTNHLYAVAEMDDGSLVNSPPFPVRVAWPALPARTNVSSVNHLHPAYAKYYFNALDPSFSWDNPPTATAFLSNQVFSVPHNQALPFNLHDYNQYSAYEFVSYFQAPSNAVYDFMANGYGLFTLLIDGSVVYSNSWPVVKSVKLEKGRHEVRLRTAAESGFDFFVRGPGIEPSEYQEAYLDTQNSAAPDLSPYLPEPPKVEMLMPSPNQRFQDGLPVPIEVRGEDGDAALFSLSLWEGTNLLSETFYKPTLEPYAPASIFSTNWSFLLTNLTAGTHHLRAIAVNGAGLASTSAVVTVTMVPGGLAIDPLSLGLSVNWHDGLFLNTQTGLVVGAGGTIVRTANGGAQWQTVGSGTSRRLNALERIGQNIFVAGDQGWIGISTNGGISWRQEPIGTTYNFNDLAFGHSNNGAAVGDRGTIYLFHQGAWVSQVTGVDENIHAVAAAGAKFFAVGEEGLILRGDSLSWTEIDLGLRHVTFHDVAFADSQRGMAVGSGGTILTTADGGATWQVRASGTTENLHSLRLMENGMAWVVGSRGILLQTVDAGRTWKTIPLPTAPDLRAVFLGSGRGLIVGLAGAAFQFNHAEFPLNNAPLVQWVYPTPSAFLIGGFSTLLRATAQDDQAVARVEFFAGGVKIGESTGPVFEVTWPNIPEGLNQLTARAMDSQGASTMSEPLLVRAMTLRLLGQTQAELDVPMVFTNGAPPGEFDSFQVDFGNGVAVELPSNWRTITNYWGQLGLVSIRITGRKGNQLFHQTNQVTITGSRYDEWRYDYFGHGFRGNPSARNDADDDADGQSNWQEFQAGTDPTNRASSLRIDSATLSPTLAWETVPGKRYRIMRTQNIQSITLIEVGRLTAASGQRRAVFVDTNLTVLPQQYYRLEILAE